MSSTPLRDERLLAIGQQCSEPLCHLVDFLPFKCQHCTQPFCAEHFKVEAHRCSQYDESKHDRIAPSCPMCNEPVAIPPGQDPNIRMERHMDTECSVMTGKRQKKSAPVCARGKCGKVLFAPISCSNCKQQFCPAHRFPADHACAPTTTTSASRPAAQHIADASAKASAAGTSAAQAVRRQWAAMPAPAAATARPAPARAPAGSAKLATASAAPPAKMTPASSASNPFSKTDRRAKAERESRRRAMEARAKKGLLSEEEKAILAAEAAQAREAGSKKDGCVVM